MDSKFELRRRSISEVLDVVFKFYAKGFKDIITVSFLCMLPSFLILIVANFAKDTLGAPVLASALSVAAPFVNMVFVGIMVGAIVFIIKGIYLNETVSAKDALSKAWNKINNILAVQIGSFIVIFLGFLCFIIPGIYFAFRYALCVPAAVLEEYTSFGSALGRSKQLVKYNASKVVATLIGIFIIIMILSMVLASAFIASTGLIGLNSMIDNSLVGSILDFIPQVLFAPLYSILTVVLYYDCRIVGEAYDLEVMSLEEQ